MNSYERVKRALQLKEPDQVPIIEFTIDPKVIKGACPEAKDQADFAEIVGLDGVSCMGSSQFKKISGNSDGTYGDEWGVLYKKGGSEVVSHPIRGPIQTMDDLEDYVPPDPDAPHLLGELLELVKRFKGKKAIIFAHRAAFMWSVFLTEIPKQLKSLFNSIFNKYYSSLTNMANRLLVKNISPIIFYKSPGFCIIVISSF